MAEGTIKVSGYSIQEQIYGGSITLVYKGIRESDQKPVVIKLLRNEYPSFSEIVQFRNQYTITKNLDITGVVKTYSLETCNNSYALVMEDFGGISLKRWLQNVKSLHVTSLQDFLIIAIQITTILDQLHRNRIIHKDIKPANILINPKTKQIKLIDFSISSLLPRETGQLQNLNILEGTLAYISPEQTGRMNRGIDYRTDFYSLGVTFYELLTGKLPFIGDDLMELVHCHIAKTPPFVNETNKNITLIISDILAKLLAKNAEDRYQSALGLKYDLETCLSEYKKAGKITPFILGRKDISDYFVIPEKLYGREKEVKALLEVFQRASKGQTEMILVAGCSGIGKTTVIDEVHKPIVKQKGYFIKGKYNQFQRNIPLSAFVQAFQELIGQLLSESDAKVRQWRANILNALGENAQVIIEVIPELEKVIGKQAAATELSGSAAQNRFNLLFQKFTQVFTSQEHPLVIFLDDLQWADSSSLKLMELLMIDTKYLLLIGAYRDNEVSVAHPLMLTLDNISKAEGKYQTITLAPLSQLKVNKLVADTLKCSEDLAFALSQLVSQKTQGNPFFVRQFLKALYQDGIIEFNFEVRCWQCDIMKVRHQALTDDVVMFMAFQLKRLPQSTQQILQLAACIGNQFDLTTLAIVCEESEIETAAYLWKALEEGLILPVTEVYKFYQEEHNQEHNQELQEKGNTSQQVTNQQVAKYRFSHDRVQQAAYSQIPANQRQRTHLKIGQLLLQNSSEIEREEKLFDIVGHLNIGRDLIMLAEEREVLAQLNLATGQKANNTTAYALAITYAKTGIELLKTDCWKSQYNLTLGLYLTVAEATYLNGDFEDMEEIAMLILQNAQTIFDKIKVYEIQIGAQTVQGNLLKAIAIGQDALQELEIKEIKEINLPIHGSEAEIGEALQSVSSQLQSREIEKLLDLPLMTDIKSQSAMRILTMLLPPTFQGKPGLFPLWISIMMSLSLQSGNTTVSSMGYAGYGMILCAYIGDVKAGYAFGKLAINLLERWNARSVESIILDIFGAFVQHRQEPLKAAMHTLKTGYTAGIQTGGFLYASYNILNYSSASFFCGVELSSWEIEMAVYSNTLGQLKQYSNQIYVNIVRQTVHNLVETVSQPNLLMGTAYDETKMLPKHLEDNDITGTAVVYIYKLLLAYNFGNYTAAIDYIDKAEKYLIGVGGLIYIPIFHLYAALTLLKFFPTQSETEKAKIIIKLKAHQTTLQQWSIHAPMNYLHKWYLIEAEQHRVLDEKLEAIECYENAISLAQKNEYINEEALANELAAKFYLEWGREQIAKVYMKDAYYCYIRWGAKAKVDSLVKLYPELLVPILKREYYPLKTSETFFLTSYSTVISSNIINIIIFDLARLIKAFAAIFSEIEIEKLLFNIMKAVLGNAGAEFSTTFAVGE
jgi:predicted ATPase/tRNA A-37 threonylcarbamoyl transferase component Bud32